MAKNKNKRESTVEVAVHVMRAGAYADRVEAMRDGRRERANTFTDRRRKANRQACRGKFSLAD